MRGVRPAEEAPQNGDEDDTVASSKENYAPAEEAYEDKREVDSIFHWQSQNDSASSRKREKRMPDPPEQQVTPPVEEERKVIPRSCKPSENEYMKLLHLEPVTPWGDDDDFKGGGLVSYMTQGQGGYGGF